MHSNHAYYVSVTLEPSEYTTATSIPERRHAAQSHGTKPFLRIATPIIVIFITHNSLLDARFTRGEYHGTVRHESDWEQVLQRARQVGCDRIVLTAGTVEESRRAVATARAWNNNNNNNSPRLACTVGVSRTKI